MNIVDFFDPNNLDHVLAYEHLRKTGIWPDNFIPTGTEFTPQWHVLITAKLADAYVDWKLELVKREEENSPLPPDALEVVVNELLARGIEISSPDELILAEPPWGWNCPESPTGYCVYDHPYDLAHDHCLFCHDPEERK